MEPIHSRITKEEDILQIQKEVTHRLGESCEFVVDCLLTQEQQS